MLRSQSVEPGSRRSDLRRRAQHQKHVGRELVDAIFRPDELDTANAPDQHKPARPSEQRFGPRRPVLQGRELLPNGKPFLGHPLDKGCPIARGVHPVPSLLQQGHVPSGLAESQLGARAIRSNVKVGRDGAQGVAGFQVRERGLHRTTRRCSVPTQHSCNSHRPTWLLVRRWQRPADGWPTQVSQQTGNPLHGICHSDSFFRRGPSSVRTGGLSFGSGRGRGRRARPRRVLTLVSAMLCGQPCAGPRPPTHTGLPIYSSSLALASLKKPVSSSTGPPISKISRPW